MNRKHRAIILVSALVLSFVPMLAVAQLGSDFIPSSGPELTFSRIEVLLRRVGAWLITIAVVVAVIVIVWGGISYMMAGANTEKTSRAAAIIKNGIIGIAIVMAVGLILNTLSSIITQTFFGV